MGLWIYVCFFLFFISSVSCCGLSMNYGSIVPIDPDIKVNDTLKIQCSLFNSTVNYKNHTYEVSSENLLWKFDKDFLYKTNIVDDLTIEYVVENAQESDSGGYSCYLTLPEMNQNVFVCSTAVSVGYPPLPVQNFSCISYEYTNLTCSWIKPYNPVKTDYTLYDYLFYESLKRECPEKLNETSCRWTLDTKPQYRVQPDKLYFLILGKNSLGQSKQYAVEDHFKIVKPGVTRNVMIMNVTPTSVVVRWSPPKYMGYQFSPGLEYSVQYQAISPVLGDVQDIRNISFGEGLVSIKNLVPYTEYRFSVRCRSTKVDNDEFWSPSITRVERTEPDVPYLAPEMAPSSFDVENIMGNRTVTVYWKAVPVEYENGENFQYVVNFHIYHVALSRIIRESDPIIVGNKTLYSFPHLDSHTAYIFRIYAVNNMGRSVNSSHVIIDKSEKLLEKPKDIIVLSYGQGEFNLSWKASNQRPYNFTVYWCKTVKPRPSKCDGPLEWLHTTRTKLMLRLPDKDTSYQFAVSANDDGYTSGMSWASCIVYYKGVNYKVRNVGLLPKNATSLKIQWSLECEAQKIVMKEYAIQYCEFAGPCSQNYHIKSCSDWKTANVSDVSRDDYILGSLKPYTYYMAFIRVHTLSGWSGNSNLACEMTMSTAPSDPPHNVRVVNIDGKHVTLSFESPKIPNGIVTRYKAYYNKSGGSSHEKVFWTKDILHKDNALSIKLTDYMLYYSNYSIELVACVDQACSEKSKPVYAFTSISYPDIISSPRIEVLDEIVNITWDDPVLPNGPLDYFQLIMEGHNASRFEIFNVTGKNFFILHPNCSQKIDDMVYDFSVRAVNIKDGYHLYGRYSNPTKNKLCASATPVMFYVGLAVGGTAAISILILIGYLTVNWMKKQVEMIRSLRIQLPKDLDSPMENPLSSYDKFKNGLQTNHDSGIPCDTSYERLCEFAQDRELARVTEENSQKLKRKSSGRNNSGESSASGKCHDSISSSNTTKTHLSIDSGAEIDSPPSPDGLFSDTSSTHTTPRSYKPGLTIVQESNGCTSKDSGLEREGSAPFINHNVHLPSKFAYFVKKKNAPFTNVQIPNVDGIPSYSKFAILSANNTPSFIPYGEQSIGLLDQQSLSNSEPSVAEFDTGNVSEPLMPYCKFGLARSAGNGLNVANQPIAVQPKLGYSKFGTVYRALKRQDSSNIPNINDIQGLPKFLPHNPQTFTALTVTNPPEIKQPMMKDMDKAYSKFGISNPKNNVPINGYVCFKDTLSYPSTDSSTAYSKVGITANKALQPENGSIKENGIIINPSELQTLPTSSHSLQLACNVTKNPHCSLSKDRSSSKSEIEDSIANHKTQSDPDSIEEEDKDCIILNSSPAFYEMTSDLSSNMKPTNCTISANNDSKGFLLQDESSSEQSNHLTFMGDVLKSCDFHLSGDPISINMEDLNLANSSDDFCEQCNHLMTECTCKVSKDLNRTEVICNGHTSPLPNLSDYVQVGCKPAC